jgi:hypothetical protein
VRGKEGVERGCSYLVVGPGKGEGGWRVWLLASVVAGEWSC